VAMTQLTQARQPRPSLVPQLTRFVLVGGFCALVDYGSYLALVGLGLWVHLAKALAWVLGTLTAYVINRRWVFHGAGGGAQFASVMVLYGTTFTVQIGMNAVMLAVLPPSLWRLTLAFVIAQGTATCINFVVQRLVIFRN
jgi:putative flippase GtrA